MNTRNKIKADFNRKERYIIIMQLQPVGDNIILKIEIKQKEEKTKGGVVLLNEGTEQSLRTEIASVVATGEGRILNDGKMIPLTVKTGDKVIYNKFAGTEINADGEKYLILKETDILAKIK